LTKLERRTKYGIIRNYSVGINRETLERVKT
jgi:hypothetical protein